MSSGQDKKKKKLLFLALIMLMLQTGGSCASIVLDTVLTVVIKPIKLFVNIW